MGLLISMYGVDGSQFFGAGLMCVSFDVQALISLIGK